MANDKAVCVSGLSDNKPPSSYFTIISYMKIKVNVITRLWPLNRHTSHEINFHSWLLSHYKVQLETCPQSVEKTLPTGQGWDSAWCFSFWLWRLNRFIARRDLQSQTIGFTQSQTSVITSVMAGQIRNATWVPFPKCFYKNLTWGDRPDFKDPSSDKERRRPGKLHCPLH